MNEIPTVEEVEATTGLNRHELQALLDGVTPKVCANDNCGAQFLIQAGRAGQGKYRTVGVIYCSRQCANAQNRRDARRRNRPV